MALVEVKVPDIGDFENVEVIEVLVKAGDAIRSEQSLVTVESDKASMEIPSSAAGVVKEMKVKVGDKVSEGSLLLMLDSEGAAAAPAPSPQPSPALAGEGTTPTPSAARAEEGRGEGGTVEVLVPDIGDFAEVAVIEVFIKPGDSVTVEQSLITVESDKASMEIPSSHAGVVKDVMVKIGDKVSKGSVVTVLAASDARAATPLSPQPSPAAAGEEAKAPAPARVAPTAVAPPRTGALPHASPSVRRFARELGVPLDEVSGSGPKGRITHDDVQGFVKRVMAGTAQTKAASAKAPAAPGAALPGLLPWPQVDFTKFGPIERKELSRIKKISAPTCIATGC